MCPAERPTGSAGRRGDIVLKGRGAGELQYDRVIILGKLDIRPDIRRHVFPGGIRKTNKLLPYTRIVRRLLHFQRGFNQHDETVVPVAGPRGQQRGIHMRRTVVEVHGTVPPFHIKNRQITVAIPRAQLILLGDRHCLVAVADAIEDRA